MKFYPSTNENLLQRCSILMIIFYSISDLFPCASGETAIFQGDWNVEDSYSLKSGGYIEFDFLVSGASTGSIYDMKVTDLREEEDKGYSALCNVQHGRLSPDFERSKILYDSKEEESQVTDFLISAEGRFLFYALDDGRVFLVEGIYLDDGEGAKTIEVMTSLEYTKQLQLNSTINVKLAYSEESGVLFVGLQTGYVFYIELSELLLPQKFPNQTLIDAQDQNSQSNLSSNNEQLPENNTSQDNWKERLFPFSSSAEELEKQSAAQLVQQLNDQMQKSKERMHFQKEIESRKDTKAANNSRQTNQQNTSLRLISNLPPLSSCNKLLIMNNNQLAILTEDNTLIVIQLQLNNTKIANITGNNNQKQVNFSYGSQILNLTAHISDIAIYNHQNHPFLETNQINLNDSSNNSTLIVLDSGLGVMFIDIDNIGSYSVSELVIPIQQGVHLAVQELSTVIVATQSKQIHEYLLDYPSKQYVFNSEIPLDDYITHIAISQNNIYQQREIDESQKQQEEEEKEDRIESRYHENHDSELEETVSNQEQDNDNKQQLEQDYSKSSQFESNEKQNLPIEQQNKQDSQRPFISEKTQNINISPKKKPPKLKKGKQRSQKLDIKKIQSEDQLEYPHQDENSNNQDQHIQIISTNNTYQNQNKYQATGSFRNQQVSPIPQTQDTLDDNHQQIENKPILNQESNQKNREHQQDQPSLEEAESQPSLASPTNPISQNYLFVSAQGRHSNFFAPINLPSNSLSEPELHHTLLRFGEHTVQLQFSKFSVDSQTNYNFFVSLTDGHKLEYFPYNNTKEKLVCTAASRALLQRVNSKYQYAVLFNSSDCLEKRHFFKAQDLNNQLKEKELQEQGQGQQQSQFHQSQDSLDQRQSHCYAHGTISLEIDFSEDEQKEFKIGMLTLCVLVLVVIIAFRQYKAYKLKQLEILHLKMDQKASQTDSRKKKRLTLSYLPLSSSSQQPSVKQE